MATRVWLLVEWIGVENLIPSYSMVDVDTLAYSVTKLQPGKLISMRKHQEVRQAKILHMSENKRDIQKQMVILKRRDRQMVKDCLQRMQQSKSWNSLEPKQQTDSHSQVPNVADEDSSSDSEVDGKIDSNKPSNSSKSTSKYPHKNIHQQSTVRKIRGRRAKFLRHRSVISNSTRPSTCAQKKKKLCLDQETQTEVEYVELPPNSMVTLESKVKLIYKRYNQLLHFIIKKGLIPELKSKCNNEASFIEVNTIDGAEVSGSTDKVEKKINPRTLRARKAPAEPTNNIEVADEADMVPIGKSSAKVPARLLKDIDWTTHTMATRQLMHAIFPRRVLATHSLTGKPSPAFLDKPAKEMLDPEIIDDIIKIVSKKSCVPKNLVRSSIRIKCADEAKLYRKRQSSEQTRKRHRSENEENVPPSSSSGESHADENELPPIKRTRKSLRLK